MPDFRISNAGSPVTYPENLGNVPGYIELGVQGVSTPGSYPFHVDSSGNLTANTLNLTTSSGVVTPPLNQGYNAWSYDPALTQGSAPSISTTAFAVLIYVTQTFTTANVDWIEVTGTPNVTCGLWPATAPAGTAHPLAWTTAAAATAGAVNTQAWNTSVSLNAGSSYMVTIYGSATGTVAAMASAQSYITNAAVSGAYSASTTYRAATVGTIAGTLSASSVFGTSTLSADLVWIGLH
jgi:hypothetical protein